MNSVIVHFRALREEVLELCETIGILNENCASKAGDRFYFWEYMDYESEYSNEEKQCVEALLECRPISSFQLACKTAYARFALEKLIQLTESQIALVDDDNGGYWRPEELVIAYKSSPEGSIYTIGKHQS